MNRFQLSLKLLHKQINLVEGDSDFLFDVQVSLTYLIGSPIRNSLLKFLQFSKVVHDVFGNFLHVRITTHILPFFCVFYLDFVEEEDFVFAFLLKVQFGHFKHSFCVVSFQVSELGHSFQDYINELHIEGRSKEQKERCKIFFFLTTLCRR